MMDTDDAPSLTVLAVVGQCAASWAPEARIIGNVRAGDIVRSVDQILAFVMDSMKEDQMAKHIEDIASDIDEMEGQG